MAELDPEKLNTENKEVENKEETTAEESQPVEAKVEETKKDENGVETLETEEGVYTKKKLMFKRTSSTRMLLEKLMESI